MQNVLAKAQELGLAIVESEIYKRMQESENTAMADTDSAKAMSDYMEKRHAVENALQTEDIDPVKLAEIAKEMEDAEQIMNNMPAIKEMTEARKSFQAMMGNVNQILQLLITGKTEPNEHGCTGSCSSCGGCH